MSKKSLAWLAGACLLLGTHGTASSQTLHFEDEPQVLESPPAALYSPHFPEGGDAWESWIYTFVFQNGTVLTSQFSVSNIGPKKASGLAVGTILPPQGNPVVLRNSRKRKEWTYTSDEKGLSLNIARHQLEIRPPSHKIHMLHGEGEFTIDAISTMPALRPGVVQFPKKQFYDLTLLAPRLTAHGKARIGKEPEVDLGEGIGIGLHAYSNFGEHDQAISSLRFDTFDQDLQLSLLEFTTPKEFKHQRLSLLVLFEKGKVLSTAYGYDRDYQELETDPHKSKYRYPKSFRFSSQTGPVKVSGTARLELAQRIDVLEWVGSSFLRFMARQVSHPIFYKLRAHYELEVDRGDGTPPQTLRGEGFASFQLLNAPPKAF